MPNIQPLSGDWTLLHSVCRYGHRDFIEDLIVKFGCDAEQTKEVRLVILVIA